MALKILKFGGTSLGTPEALRLVSAIIQNELPEGGVVVVSALSGITDQLLVSPVARVSPWPSSCPNPGFRS